MNLPGLEDKYEIIRPLGEGGMGVVYLALQKRIDRKVAIKSIAPYLARDPAVRERFAAEAAVLARLNHPNIVTLYDYIEEENALYLVMEYVEGQSLSELLKAGPLPHDLLLKYFSQVLEAFAYAHEQGVIHRDIKPSNIMITAGGRVKILDFGVARLLQTDHSLTRTGMRLGTLMYMSPEQVKGERDIDHRADIYSLGVVLYEMLTARPPYPPDMSEFDISIRIVQEPLFDLSHPPSEIPAQLLEVILRATEKTAAYRYADCNEFLRDFEKAFTADKSSASLPATRISSSENVSPPSTASRRSKIGWWIGGSFLLLAIASGIWYATRPASLSTIETQSSDTLLTFQESETVSMGAEEFEPVQSLPPENPPPQSEASPPAPVSSSRPSPGKPSSEKSPAPTAALPPSSPKSSMPPPKPVIRTEIENFRESSLAQLRAKGTLIIRNTGEAEASSVAIILHFLNKKGKVEYTDTLYFARLKPGESISQAFQARVIGIKSVQAEVLSPRP